MWVLLHGTPLNPTVWDDVRARLHAPAITPDLNRPYPAATLHRDLAAVVLPQLPAVELTVVGHSFGGQIAIELALAAPQQVRHLILVCTRDTPILKFGDAATALRHGDAIDVDARLHAWFTEDEIDDDGPAVRYTRKRLELVDPLHYAYTLDALVRYDRRDAVADITAPTTVICGGQDPICTPTVMTDLADRLRCSDLHIVDEWAHMSPFAHPARFAELLAEATR